MMGKAIQEGSGELFTADDLRDQLAQELLEEIEWESRWDSTLEDSQEKLEKLAEKALREYRVGKTKEIGLDDL